MGIGFFFMLMLITPLKHDSICGLSVLYFEKINYIRLVILVLKQSDHLISSLFLPVLKQIDQEISSLFLAVLKQSDHLIHDDTLCSWCYFVVLI